MLNNAHIAQVVGPFSEGVNLLDKDQAIGQIVGSQNPMLYKIGIQALPETVVSINGTNIKIGSTGIYQLDDIVMIKSLSFPNGAQNTTIIDFVYAGKMVY